MSTMSPGFKPPPRGVDLPICDGENMESPRHREQMVLLISTLNDAWADRTDFHVDGNCFVYFSELQAKKNDFRGPDVFVVMDTVKKERRSWVVWEEEGRTPDVVIELLSETTEHIDRGDKMRIYAQLLHVAETYLFDPWSGVFEAYELDVSARAYRRRTPDELGRFHSAATGMSLGVMPTRIAEIDAPLLRWFGPDGQVLPTGQEKAARHAARAEIESARAEREAARAEEALRRVAELERALASK